MRTDNVPVNNAAHQQIFESLEEISDAEWQRTFATDIHAMFHLVKAAAAHMDEGASIINTTSINADKPKETLLAYATSKGAIHNFTAGLAQLLAERKIRVNAVAPGPVWTPLIPPGDAGGAGQEPRPGDAAGPGGGAGNRLRLSDERPGELRHRRDDPGDEGTPFLRGAADREGR